MAGGRITSTPGDELTSVEVIVVVVIVIMMVTDGAGGGNGAGGIGDGKTSWPGDGVGPTLLDVQGSPASTTAGSCYGRPRRETPSHWRQLRGEHLLQIFPFLFLYGESPMQMLHHKFWEGIFTMKYTKI